MNRFNLVVSTYRFREQEAQDEIVNLLQMFGDSEGESEITEIKGILLAYTLLDPLHVIARLKDLVSSEPWQIRYVLRVIPIQVVIPTDTVRMGLAAKSLSGTIGPGKTFRITVEKRHSSLDSMQVIKSIAGEIQNKVDLKNPDWLIMVQILGAQTGISIIRPDLIFSSVIEKRK